jgi:acetyl esterase/lipase
MRALTGLTGHLGRHRGSGDVEVITLGSGARVRLFRPAGVTGPTPALLWIHGGGYVIGTAQLDDRLCRRFSRRLGMTVASVEYRLAPEHPYPAPLPCQVEVVPGAFHGFDLVAPKTRVSRRFFDSQCDSLRAALVPAA